ncbi:MAG: amylo-alpha-1,6-glucosidase [Phormidesmis sp.]
MNRPHYLSQPPLQLSPKAITFGRDICSDLAQATGREWLITNGTGSYGCGTLSGILTRCYHGLLIAALKPPLGRTLLLTKLDETVHYQSIYYPLSCDRWAGGTTTGHGYRNLESFQLEGTIPTWHYACADALLEKRIWMQPGENTTYIRYTLRRASGPLTLSIKAIVNYRDHHSTTQSNQQSKQIQTQSHPRGLKVQALSQTSEQAAPFYLLTSKGQMIPASKWYQHYFLTTEKYRGLAHLDDNFHAATLRTTLSVGESITIVASTQPAPNLDGEAALQIRQADENALLNAFSSTLSAQGSPAEETLSTGSAPVEPWLKQWVLAADQFVVNRALPNMPTGKTIIAGYPWFGDWGRDTMIALPGLTLATGRPDIARPILQTFAQYLSQGMLPNAFPEANDTPGYNTVDATLWYFEAIRAYIAATQDFELLSELFPALTEVLDWHVRGTRYSIEVDPSDGLLYAGEPDAQLTWMDAKVDDWVVTPRIGKPVEINALWINALCCMACFAEQLTEPAEKYASLVAAAAKGFERFWHAGHGHCYDVLDGPNGHDASLRPNQLFAVSLIYGPVLTPLQNKAIVDVCAQQLLTSHGLRSLCPKHPDYIGVYGGDRFKRDGAYHQGTVWAWLIGPFIQAHLKVYKNPQLARTFLIPLAHHLSAGCIGTLSEIFDGDAPFTPRGAYAQAWSVAEGLRAWQLIEHFLSPNKEQ